MTRLTSPAIIIKPQMIYFMSNLGKMFYAPLVHVSFILRFARPSPSVQDKKLLFYKSMDQKIVYEPMFSSNT